MTFQAVNNGGAAYIAKKRALERNTRLRQSLSKQPTVLFVTEIKHSMWNYSLQINLPLQPRLYNDNLSVREIESIQSYLKSAWDGDCRNGETCALAFLCGIVPVYLCWLPSLLCNGGMSEFQRALSKVNRDMEKKGLYFQFESTGSNVTNSVGFLTLHQI